MYVIGKSQLLTSAIFRLYKMLQHAYYLYSMTQAHHTYLEATSFATSATVYWI